MDEVMEILYWILLFIFIASVFFSIYFYSKSAMQAKLLRDKDEELLNKEEERITREEERDLHYEISKRTQKSKICGDDVAKFLPFAEEYFSLYNSRDLVRISDVTDYITFVGKVNGKITEVVFQEVKFGSAGLSNNQKSLKKCIEEKRVRWETWWFDKESKSFSIKGSNKDSGVFSKNLTSEIERLLSEGLSKEEIYEKLSEGSLREEGNV